MKSFKNMLMISALSMLSGASITAVLLSNTSTKRKADELLNTAMDNAQMKMQKMKKKMNA